MKRIIPVLLLLLVLFSASCACADALRPLEIDPADIDLENGTFRLEIRDEDRIDGGGYFTAGLFLENCYDAARVEALVPGDTVEMSGTVFTVKMVYPCIVYSLETIDTRQADNLPYMKNRAYSVIIIDKNPDSEFVDKLSELKLCRFERHYTANNLNHWVFRIYYKYKS